MGFGDRMNGTHVDNSLAKCECVWYYFIILTHHHILIFQAFFWLLFFVLDERLSNSLAVERELRLWCHH